MKLTKKQGRAVIQARDMLDANHSDVILGGLAGTGKTTLVRHFHEALKMPMERVAYAAFTGKAASVMNKMFVAAGAPARATTIHSLIYLPVEHHCQECPRREDAGRMCHAMDCPECRVSYKAKPELPSEIDLVIIDEASMVPGFVYDQLVSYGVPVIWIGDHGQLPPVKSGFALMEHPDIVLEEIHRHVADSPILQMAMRVRETGQPPRLGKHGPGVVVRRSGGSFDFETEEFSQGSLVALSPTNKLRISVNKAVRAAMKYGSEPQVEDRVICLRNNKKSAVFNGLTGRILDIEPSWLGLPVYHTEIVVDDGDFTYRGSASVDQFGGLETAGGTPREIDLWDYGYCLTVHKSQGSEYERVVLYCNLAKVSDRKRWLYTAITRAKNRLEILYAK